MRPKPAVTAQSLVLSLCFALATLLPASAQTRPEVRALYDALLMEDVIEIMQIEGIAYGEDLRQEMFPGRGGAAWPALVARLYDSDAMHRLVLERFDTLLADQPLEPLLAFFQSERGARIVELELEARRAMMDSAVEDAAREAITAMRQDDDPRLDVLETFVAANELVDSNVVGAMNANYAFYVGLMDGGALEQNMTEASILTDVWSQEPEIRADTVDWVYSYLGLAYQPLSDDDIAVYTALSETQAGRALNRAIFGAFDTMYVAISGALGQGAAQFMAGEEL